MRRLLRAPGALPQLTVRIVAEGSDHDGGAAEATGWPRENSSGMVTTAFWADSVAHDLYVPVVYILAITMYR